MGNTTNDICTLHPFERNRYFYGKLLTVRDFEIEQSYFRGKDALINRIIHGGGIVCGLEVDKDTLKEENGKLTIDLSAGVAIDCCGREIVVSASGSIDVVGLPQNGLNYLYLKYKECNKESVPVLTDPSVCEEKCEYNRIKEIFEVVVSIDSPDAGKVKVAGKVTESDGTTAIQSAIVEAMQDGAVKNCAMTGSDGNYELLITSGTYTIQASASGFVTSAQEITVTGNVTQNFTLAKVAAPPDPKSLKANLAQDYYEKYLQTCLQCGTQEDAKVLLAIINKTDTTITIDDTFTRKYRLIVPNNPMLYKLLSAHIADFNNPHQTTAEQVGALVSVDDVQNPGGNIDLIQDDAITITSDDAANTITIGETHSARTDNPHQTTAAQVGAPVSVDGVQHPGGDIDLIQANAITINPDDTNNRITIGETHSTRTDNPHNTTAAQVGAIRSVDGVRNDGGDIDLIQANAITITSDDANNRITIGETHSARTDNPHNVTAAQMGGLVSVDGVQNPGGNIDLVAGDNITITPTPATNSIKISATGGIEPDLTTLKIWWRHRGDIDLNSFMEKGLQLEFSNPLSLDIDMQDILNEVFLVAAKSPFYPLHGDIGNIGIYHHEYLPGKITLDGTLCIFVPAPDIRGYLESILGQQNQLTILVQLNCDFVIDGKGRAVDGHHIGGTGKSGIRLNGKPYGLQGGLFESWFNLIPAPIVGPIVTGVEPDRAFQGDKLPVTIVGGNFQQRATVAFSGKGINVDYVEFISNLQLQVGITIASDAPPGASDVIVINPDGNQGIGKGLFQVVERPIVIVEGVKPDRAFQGDELSVTIFGSNFQKGATVAFSNEGIKVGVVEFISNSELQAQIAIASTAPIGARDVTVTNPDGNQGTGKGLFRVDAPVVPPSVEKVDPDHAIQGEQLSVAISGGNFQKGTRVSFSGSGIDVGNVGFITASELQARISIASTAPIGARDVTVTNLDGNQGTGKGLFRVDAPVVTPIVEKVGPDRAFQGEQFSVTISGSNFKSGAKVTFSGDGIDVTGVEIISASQLQARIAIASKAQPGARDILVTNPAGNQGVGKGLFQVIAVSVEPPQVTKIEPDHAFQGEQLSVTIAGSDFKERATIAFSGGGIEVTDVKVISASQLQVGIVISREAKPGARDVFVTNPDGQQGIGKGLFQIDAPFVLPRRVRREG